MRRGLLFTKTFFPVFLLLLALLVLGAIASLLFGARSLSVQEVLGGLFGAGEGLYEASVVQKRVVRTVFALCCGAALGIAGVLMQAVTRNPLADPAILGVNNGAAFFVVCGIAFFQMNTAREYIWFALAGAFVTAVFVLGIGSMGRGGASPLKLVLAGAATSAALSSLVTAVLIPRLNAMDEFRFWQAGSVGAGTWDSFWLLLPFLIVGVIAAVISAPAMNALALGDETATGLGVKTAFMRYVAALAGVILCGAVTAVAGPIGFVGLLSVHVIRALLGPDVRVLVPMSALAGAVILTVSDVVGRLIGRPGELEVGVLTAFIGAPLLIILALKAKVRAV